MAVIISRVDERLVHGQIITSWSKQLRIDTIIIVDNAIAKDAFMREVLMLSAPNGLDFKILSVEEASTYLSVEDNKRTMVLFKNIESALLLNNTGYQLKALNLGNIASAATRKKITKNVSLSDTEISQVKELTDSGVEVYLQMLYTDSKVNVLDHI